MILNNSGHIRTSHVIDCDYANGVPWSTIGFQMFLSQVIKLYLNYFGKNIQHHTCYFHVTVKFETLLKF